MSTVAKLKKKAIEFEQRKQFDKALAEYRKVLDELGDSVDEADVALFNRVGDLELRQGNVSRALDHYERAVDLYSEGGFFNNAIALCNKILRNAPGRASIYYKLGMISARKGFVNDAKQNFLEYADRMQQAGKMEEAFRALREFADLCPDQDDIRLMLADQLVRKDRKSEAIEQLQTLYDKLQSEGRSREARATVERMRAIDPDMEPRAGTFKPTPKSSDLIFLDINYDGPAGVGAAGGRSPRASGAARRDESPADRVPAPESVPDAGVPDEGIPDTDLPLVEADLEGGAEPLAGLVHGASLDPSGAPDDDTLQGAPISGLERTILGGDDVARPHEDEGARALEGLELTSLSGGGPDDDLGIALDDAGAFPELRASDAPDDSGELPGLDAFSDDQPLASGYELTSVDDTLLPEEETSLGMDLPMLDVPDAQDESASIGDTLSFIDTSDPAGVLGLAGGEEESPLFGGDADEISLRPRANVSIEIQREQAGLLEFDEEPEAPAALVSDPAARRVAELHRAVANEPEKWLLHRELGEALLEAGERDGGMGQLELAMTGFEGDGDFRSARAIAEEILRLDPSSVHYHQKRVEYAFRANDKAHLVDAYLELADCLFRSGDVAKSRAVYRRVLELSPDHSRALDALAVFATGEPTPAEGTSAVPLPAMPAVAAPSTSSLGAERAAAERPAPAMRDAVRSATPDEQFVNLADWLREEDTPRSTRMVADVAHPATGEQVGFAEMLSMFKQGVAANMDEGDYDSHYDLGVAYKEMGLLDEAIAEFQKALRGTEHRVRTCEALGQCFIEKEQYQVAITVLSRALNERSHGDETLVGVLYLLGTASEALGRWQDAIQHYERVFALDIQFRDVSQRLAALERQVQ